MYNTVCRAELFLPYAIITYIIHALFCAVADRALGVHSGIGGRSEQAVGRPGVAGPRNASGHR